MEELNLVSDRLITLFGGLYLLALLLRLLLQIARADYYNPLSQAVVRVTEPLVGPLQRVMPRAGRVDLGCLAVALTVQTLLIYALAAANGLTAPAIGTAVTWAFAGILFLIINIYYWAILASIIMSFVMMFSGTTSPHPALLLIWQLTEPVMAPFRRILPPMGGLDFSPILIFIAIQFLRQFLYDVFNVTNLMATLVIGI